jgi:hypothetical protein
MPSYISKTQFLHYLHCPKYFWLEKHKPEVIDAVQISDFQQQIIDQGIEVEQWARKLYPTGKLVTSRELEAVEETKQYLENGHTVIFQATFLAEDLYAMVDVLEWDSAQECWIINEVKGTTSKETKKEVHYQDATFQKIVLEKAGLRIGKVQLIELNKEFVKNGDVDPVFLLKKTDISEEVTLLEPEILLQIADAKRLLERATEPPDCECVYKGREHHCPTFAYCHPHIPEYSVHDICRIGASPKKLQEMIDNGWFHITDVPEEFELSPTQSPQVHVTRTNTTIIENKKIQTELSAIQYPIYFLDYETYPAAIPVFDGCRPFQQVPFQYSLHILHAPDAELIHKEFLSTDTHNPMHNLTKRLREDMGDEGSVVVWNKKFEGKCNEELAALCPELATFFHSINNRFYDLMEIFSKQLFVHKDFKGSYSIKAVLSVLVPHLSYTGLDIRDGGMACSAWRHMIFETNDAPEKLAIGTHLKKYCELDTLAMVEILRALQKLPI